MKKKYIILMLSVLVVFIVLIPYTKVEIQTILHSDEFENVKNEMVVKLDEYLLILEEQLKNNSDVVFNKVLEDASKKLREIRLAAD
ncbi:MAG: hypothetical protein IJA27_08145, partial [Lachnospiraceae bacterium]|nr:hypothetical protein [Lachnospiraceae bacterium]